MEQKVRSERSGDTVTPSGSDQSTVMPNPASPPLTQ